jgi:hypothetical protein
MAYATELRGKVVTVRGAVVDVAFELKGLPQLDGSRRSGAALWRGMAVSPVHGEFVKSYKSGAGPVGCKRTSSKESRKVYRNRNVTAGS